MCREELERLRADGGEKRDEWRLNGGFEHLGHGSADIRPDTVRSDCVRKSVTKVGGDGKQVISWFHQKAKSQVMESKTLVITFYKYITSELHPKAES